MYLCSAFEMFHDSKLTSASRFVCKRSMKVPACVRFVARHGVKQIAISDLMLELKLVQVSRWLRFK